jgi:outer membrane protein assembly factor BamB
MKVQPCAYNGVQWWTYNRKSGVIVNPDSGACLEVPSESVDAGAAVALGTCLDPAPLRQQWTYDPEGGALRNGLYTVLDVQGGNLLAGTPVAMWDAHGGSNQQWQAEGVLPPPPNAPTECGQLKPDEGLNLGESLSSCDGRFTLTLSESGDVQLVENSTGAQLWHTSTSGVPISYLRMQSDGNLVLLNIMGGSVWHSNSWGNPGAVMVLQDDANLVIYGTAGQVLFKSDTCCR